MNMNFRKLFNVQTPEQKKIIVGEVAAIKNLADKEADKKNDNNRKYDSDANSKCPNCGSTTIVDKIQEKFGEKYIKLERVSLLFSIATLSLDNKRKRAFESFFDTNEKKEKILFVIWYSFAKPPAYRYICSLSLYPNFFLICILNSLL